MRRASRFQKGRDAMSRTQTRRRAPEIPLPAGKKTLERALQRQMALAAGTEFFRHRDPLYHVTESFQQTFDAMGLKHSARLTAAEEERESGEAEQRPGQAPPSSQGDRKTGGVPDRSSVRSFYGQEGRQEQDKDMLRRFAETAFQRGTMSAAVLQGTGRMMLFSCLKKTVGQSQPVREQQRKLFGGGSQLRNVGGSSPDKVMFNRGFTDSAVGLVVDTLRDARRTVEDMQGLARGALNRNEAGAHGADTLRSMYPFLDDSREREMLERYYARLNWPEAMDTDEKALIQSAVNRTRALIEKKERMRVEFINKLRFISDRAAEALAELEEPGFAAALDTALREAMGAEEPPGGGGADDGTAEPGPEKDGADAAADPASAGADLDA